MAEASKVLRLQRDDRNAVRRWDDFVATCPAATFFHRSAWQGVLEDVFGHRTHYLYAEQGGRIVGVLPLAFVRSLMFGRALVSLPFASYGGVAASDGDVRAVLEDSALVLARSLGATHLELRNFVPRPDWPTQDLYVTFRRTIPDVLDEQMLGIPQKRRNMVRKALKQGLHAVRDDSVERFFPVFATNARDHGTPTLPRRYFEALVSQFGDDCRILSICDASERRLSSILCFFHRGEVMAYYAGELPEARRLAANDLKYWEVMRWARDRGCSRFDLGRSKRGTGSFDFKVMWNFEPVPLYYQYALIGRDGVPQNNPNNPKYRLMIEAWKRLPLGVANHLGPPIVRGLG